MSLHCSENFPNTWRKNFVKISNSASCRFTEERKKEKRLIKIFVKFVFAISHLRIEVSVSNLFCLVIAWMYLLWQIFVALAFVLTELEFFLVFEGMVVIPI